MIIENLLNRKSKGAEGRFRPCLIIFNDGVAMVTPRGRKEIRLFNYENIIETNIQYNLSKTNPLELIDEALTQSEKDGNQLILTHKEVILYRKNGHPVVYNMAYHKEDVIHKYGYTVTLHAGKIKELRG